MNKIHITSLATILLAIVPSAHAEELLANRGFESLTTDPFGFVWANPWNTGSDHGVAQEIGSWGAPGTVGNSMRFGGSALSGDECYQTGLNMTPYASAVLSFDLTTVAHGAPGTAYLSVSLGQSTPLDLRLGSNVEGEVKTSHISLLLTDPAYFRFTQDALVFFGGTDQTSRTSLYIDNVSLNATPVPEPATLAALGVGALSALRRRRRA